VSTERERLRTTFDSAASRYRDARPDYPAELYDDLAHGARLRKGDHLLEVGCGTGRATLNLAGRGFRITCVELGERLAARARDNLASFPEVRVDQAAFESWQHPPSSDFGLVYAATAWHWIDPTLRYRKAWRVLRPGGHLAFWSATHAFPRDGDPFFDEIQEIYDEIGEGLPADASRPGPGQLPDQRSEIEDTGLFTPVAATQFDWEVSYDADGYLGLLDTFSGHLAMQQWQRDRLYGEIRRRLAKRPDGTLRRHWGAVLHVARRLDVHD
jgi:SAM-dependent methyltransferase